MADFRCATHPHASPVLGGEVVLAHGNGCRQHRPLLRVGRLQVAHQEERVAMDHTCRQAQLAASQQQLLHVAGTHMRKLPCLACVIMQEVAQHLVKTFCLS